jgi:Flp pilus assembly protein TadD/chromosome segregation ATPase
MPIAQAAASLQDQYLQIYLTIQEADKLEADGQKAAAYKKYDQALKKLEALPKDWEPGIVNYRIKFCQEKLQSLSASVENTGSSASAAQSSGVAAPDTTKVRQTMSQLEAELEKTRKDLAAAIAETKDLRAKLAEVNHSRSQNIDEKLNELSRENQELRERLANAGTDSKSRDLEQRVADLLTEISSLKDQLQQAQAKAGQSGVSESKLQALEQKIANLTQENNVLKIQLAKSEEDKASLKAALDKNRPSEQRIADLLAQNSELTGKLAKAEETIKSLQSGGEGSVAALQSQLKTVQEQLAQQQRANAAFEQTNAELKKQLEDTQKKLASAASGNADSFQKENDMLRGIINRQLQEQARRDAAKRLAQEELDTLKIKSETLRQQIDILGSPVVVLSEEERALLRTPIAQIHNPTNVLQAPLDANGQPVPTGQTPPPASAEGADSVKNSESNVVDYRSKPRIPEDMRPYAQQASELFSQKKYDEAAGVYSKIIEKYPESLYAWSNLGVVRFQQQNYVEAQKALQQAVKLSPTDAFSYSILGIVYYQMSKFDDAINALTKAAALDPKDAKTYNYLGIACSQKGNQEAAEQQLRKAIEIDSNYGDAHFNLAVIYATQKPPAKELARKHYKQALDLGIPKDPQLDKLLPAQ